MYTTCGSSTQTIYGNYSKWLGKNAGNAQETALVEELWRGAQEEVLALDEEANAGMALEELVARADNLASLSSDYQGTFCTNAPCWHTSALTFYAFNSARCVHCVLFCYLFHGQDIGLLLDARYIAEFPWKTLAPLTERTDLKRVFVRLDEGLFERPQLAEGESFCGAFWDVVRDEAVALVEVRGEPFEEIEDGYPIEIGTSGGEFRVLKQTDALCAQKEIWLAQPKVSAADAELAMVKKELSLSRSSEERLQRGMNWYEHREKRAKIRFTKLHGLGNDYLYIYGRAPENAPALARRLSDRRRGPGADGVIFIEPSQIADFKMRIFNADGSEAKMCGNGIRCACKFVYEKDYMRRRELRVDTLSGIKTCQLNIQNGSVRSVSVDMGRAQVRGEVTLKGGLRKMQFLSVDVGNPHIVAFVRDAEKTDPAKLGPEAERPFADGINVEFVQVLSPNKLRMRVWERGSGVTMACGTGACASVRAAIEKGYCRFGEDVAVQLDGGELVISIAQDETATMTGPAETVYDGEWD